MPDDLGWELVASVGDGLHGAALPRTIPGRPPSCDKAPEQAPWLAVFEEELFAFPNGKYNDQVDTVS